MGFRFRVALFASVVVLATPLVATGTASASPSDPPLAHCEASTAVVDGTMQVLAQLVVTIITQVDLPGPFVPPPYQQLLAPGALAFTGPTCFTGPVDCGSGQCTFVGKLTATSLYGRAAARMFLQQRVGSEGTWETISQADGATVLACSNGKQTTQGAKCPASGQLYADPFLGHAFFVSFRAVCQWQQLKLGEFAVQPTINQCILAAQLPGS